MAIVKGYRGEVKIGSDVLGYMNNWEISFSGDALENTAFGDTVYDRSYQPGLRAHTISVSGYADPTADTAQMALFDGMKSTEEPTAVTVVCLYDNDTEGGWSGSAVVTGLTISDPIDGLAAFSGTFQVSGGLSTV